MEIKKALFVNFSNEAFVGVWDKQEYTFGPAGSPNDRMYMEEWKASHFAKHLTNRELLKKGLETHTSPKNPEQDVIFMEMFNKAVILEGDSVPESKVESELIDLNSKPKAKKKKEEKVEEEFEGLKE